MSHRLGWQETRLIRKDRGNRLSRSRRSMIDSALEATMRRHVVPVMAWAGLGLAFLTVYRPAWAQRVPAESHPAGAVVVIAVVSLVGLLIGVVAVGDLRERRAAEAMRLQSSVTGALRRQAVELHLALNVHVPFLRGSPAVIEVSGHVAAPEHRDIALGIVRAEVSRLRQDFVVEDRISISPR